ncbi:MAG: autoinducer binding domain-containing protein [Pseudomonadota bacterium]
MDLALREYAAVCEALTSFPDLQRESILFFKSRGLKMMSYHHIPPVGAPAGDRANLIYAYGFPKDWVARYIRDRLFEVDPIPRIGQASTKPFRWLDLVGSKEISAREQAYMDVLVSAGLGNGLAIPVFGPHGRNGYCGLGYGPDAGVPRDVEVTILHEACILSHLKYCELHPIPRVDGALSVREKTTLKHVAKGLSNNEIASQMGVSPSTIDTNLRRIYRKLGVRDRVSAVLRGIVLGIYD